MSARAVRRVNGPTGLVWVILGVSWEVETGARKLGGQPSHYLSYFSLADLPAFLHFHPMTLLDA